jgi:hypothetical protein
MKGWNHLVKDDFWGQDMLCCVDTRDGPGTFLGRAGVLVKALTLTIG